MIVSDEVSFSCLNSHKPIKYCTTERKPRTTPEKRLRGPIKQAKNDKYQRILYKARSRNRRKKVNRTVQYCPGLIFNWIDWALSQYHRRQSSSRRSGTLSRPIPVACMSQLVQSSCRNQRIALVERNLRSLHSHQDLRHRRSTSMMMACHFGPC